MKRYEALSDEALMDEVDSRPSETFFDLKWAALIRGTHWNQMHPLSQKQRKVLLEILKRSDEAAAKRRSGRIMADLDHPNTNEGHDEYGKPW